MKSAHKVFLATVLYSLMGAGALWAQPASDAANLAKGKRLFMRCSACHDAGETTPGKTGPTLKGVVGRPVGAVAGFRYSADMKSKTFLWDEAQLDAWLIQPTAVVPGTSMAFIGMPDAAERKATIAFLRNLK